MLHASEIDSICNSSHGDPFACLGPHEVAPGQQSIRCFFPGARQVQVLSVDGAVLGELARRHDDGFYEGVIALAAGAAYRLQVTWLSGEQDALDDPYRFPLVLGEMDVWLLGGTQCVTGQCGR